MSYLIEVRGLKQLGGGYPRPNYLSYLIEVRGLKLGYIILPHKLYLVVSYRGTWVETRFGYSRCVWR